MNKEVAKYKVKQLSRCAGYKQYAYEHLNKQDRDYLERVIRVYNHLYVHR